jgi:hypothetical protein
MTCTDAIACSLGCGQKETAVRAYFETADCGVEFREHG